MIRRLILSIGVVLMIVGTGTGAQGQLPTKRVLTLEAATRVADAAEAEARKNNWAVSIAVLDDSGQMLLFSSMDGAKLVATDIAIRKARTAVYFQGPTKDLEAEVAGGRTALLPIDGFMPLEGGVPIRSGGQLVGAIGVSGVTGAQDAQCALVGAAVIQ
ncbi:MAG: heme-binding protein [Acidobacteria bacterium]|nr:heme-binding protein [Acidobacteriota bacterium]